MDEIQRKILVPGNEPEKRTRSAILSVFVIICESYSFIFLDFCMAQTGFLLQINNTDVIYMNYSQYFTRTCCIS